MRNNDLHPEKILIATTNRGKFEEIKMEFKDLPFLFVSLVDLGLDKEEPEEPYDTTWENALHKARFYAQKSHLITIAEDTGLFVDYLKGAPGVKAKRFAENGEAARKKILSGLDGQPKKNRGVYFETSGVLVDPANGSMHIFSGRLNGLVGEQEVGVNRPGMMYETIFYHPPSKKYLSEMSNVDKNLISHRGQVVSQIKYFLSKQYGFKQIMVPLCLIYNKEKKLLMLKRRDSRPEFNNKWEFPGGGVEKGETVEDCVRRECLEETGYKVKIVETIPQILTHYEQKWNYQVFLHMFICAIEDGRLALRDNENNGSGWFTLEEVMKLNLLPLNRQMLNQNIVTLKKFFI